ncbi:hypothetical protein BpHYR1_005648 [Brachionus plicatilis]|uniref:Uncharacterized protein n=1 Tax=Brachionus plicatilis TaxID=10195 RepID=A0A3M7Q1K7_BRAPC|nr:hypothetical protein BpHYR1_005648 [Brachionus plicatilis]
MYSVTCHQFGIWQKVAKFVVSIMTITRKVLGGFFELIFNLLDHDTKFSFEKKFWDHDGDVNKMLRKLNKQTRLVFKKIKNLNSLKFLEEIKVNKGLRRYLLRICSNKTPLCADRLRILMKNVSTSFLYSSKPLFGELDSVEVDEHDVRINGESEAESGLELMQTTGCVS